MTESASPLHVDLSGKVAIVTGASQGIGRTVAVELGRCGALVGCVARNAQKLAETVQLVSDAGGQAEAMSCDVTDSKSVEAVVEAVCEKWEKIDILVNNAGITRDTLMPRMSDEEFDDVIATNLKGAFLFARAASMRMMRARYGRIINMSSVSGITGNAGQTNYSASKAGLIGMTRSLARELAKRNVTVNAVAPGFIESDMTRVLGEVVIEEVTKQIPMRRMGETLDIASMVLFLASDAASYITGQTMVVDGGMTA